MPYSTEKATALFLLRAALKQYPNQRIGQVLVNALGVTAPEVFYVNDEELVESLKAYLKGE